jgi:hypothetical protein
VSVFTLSWLLPEIEMAISIRTDVLEEKYGKCGMKYNYSNTREVESY